MGEAGWRARAAIMGFEALGPAAHPAILELAGLLGSKSPFVAQNAMYALANLPGQKVLILSEALTNRDSTVRLKAAEYIGHFAAMGSKFDEMDPTPAIPLLVRSLIDEDSKVEAAAARSLGRLGLESARVVPALTNRLADTNAVVRSAVAEALGSFGEQSEPVARALTRALEDDSLAVRVAASNSLRAISATATRMER